MHFLAWYIYIIQFFLSPRSPSQLLWIPAPSSLVPCPARCTSIKEKICKCLVGITEGGYTGPGTFLGFVREPLLTGITGGGIIEPTQ